MLETTLIISMISTPILTYFLAKRSVRNGIIAAYEDIMGDLMSEETILEFQTIARGVMKSVTGSVNQAMPKVGIKELGIMFFMSMLKDKIPFLGQIMQPQTQQQVIPPDQIPTQIQQVDPSRIRARPRRQ